MAELDGLCFEPGIAFTRAQIGTFFDLETLEGVAVEEDGRLAGFAIGYRRRPTLAAILTLDVDPRRRRRGLGTALFRDLLARLERAGARGVRLEVDVRNRAAISFYRRFGFRRVGRLADYYAPGLDAWEMERAARRGRARSGARGPRRSPAARNASEPGG